eukprot:gnl/Carplike_NY0171/13629_a19913_105.p1 GENE.gnl/Carplike_NY0171/13629_a19913_105~~gnl/Carplike_NY0171/13629_a19913_105.p1  ORF type:complete len:119 (+),score=38.24 gnl/Carplike_NY0171/13629_a19913_105:63-419(+)
MEEEPELVSDMFDALKPSGMDLRQDIQQIDAFEIPRRIFDDPIYNIITVLQREKIIDETTALQMSGPTESVAEIEREVQEQMMQSFEVDSSLIQSCLDPERFSLPQPPPSGKRRTMHF